MKDLPAPGARQLATLSNLLNTMSTDYGMSRENLDLRFQVFNAPVTVLRAVNSEPMARSTVSASSTMPAAPWGRSPMSLS